MDINSEIQEIHHTILKDIYLGLEPFAGYYNDDFYYDFSYYWEPIERFKDDALKYGLATSGYVSLLNRFIAEFKKEGYPLEDVIDLLKLKHEILRDSKHGTDGRNINFDSPPSDGDNRRTPDFWLHIKEDVRDNPGLRGFIEVYVKGKKGAQLVHLIFALKELDLLASDPHTAGMQTTIFNSLLSLDAAGTYAAYSYALISQKDSPKAQPNIDSLKDRIAEILPNCN